MANNYDKILELANANNMGLSNTIKRDFGIPLDYTSVQASYEAALTYAATNTLAYVGQPISVGDKLYIVTAESQGKYPAEVAEGESQIDVFLAEVGSATEGDGSTIDLVDGVLSLHGIDGKTSGTYVPSLVDGVLTWNAPDNTTVDGLTASVDALNLKVFGKEADEEAGTEKVDGLVDIVADQGESIAANAKAIEDEKTARETAISNEVTARGEAIKAITDVIGTVTEGKTVVEMIAEAEAAAKAEIPTAVSAFTNDAGYQTASDVSSAITTAIANKADKADTLAGYGITDAYTKTEVDGIVSGMTHMSTKVVDAAPSADAAELGVIYLVPASDVDAGTYLEYILVVHDDGTRAVEQIGSTKTDLSDYYKKSEVNTLLADKADKTSVYTKDEIDGTVETLNNSIDAKVAKADYENDKTTFALKSELETGLSGKVDTATLADYNTKEEVAELLTAKADKATTEAALAGKIDTASITHTSEGVSEGVTKEGTALKIVVDAYTKEQVYTKSETDAAITAKINSVTGGESAADVKLALEDYRDSINTEIWGESAREWTKKVTGDDGKVTVTYTPQYGTTSRVDTLESDVATLKTNVATAQSTADAAAQAVETLKTTEVKANADNIAALITRVGNVETQAATNKTDIGTLTGTVNGINTVVEGHTTKIGEIEATLVTLGNKDTELDTAIKANAANIEKKADKDSVYTKAEVDAKVITSGEVVRGAADGVSITDNKLTVTLDAYTKAQVDAKIAEEIGKIDDTAITNNAADIAVLVGDDKDENGRATKSVRAIALEEVTKVIDGAPEALNTLNKIADWIIDDNTGSAAVIEDIAEHEAILAGFGGDKQPKTVIEAIETAKEEAIAAIPALEVATTEKLGGIKSATGDNKVTVAEDGTASVSSVNVNSLVQTTGDVLILNGGTAVS